jgi:hypothetical protein
MSKTTTRTNETSYTNAVIGALAQARALDLEHRQGIDAWIQHHLGETGAITGVEPTALNRLDDTARLHSLGADAAAATMTARALADYTIKTLGARRVTGLLRGKHAEARLAGAYRDARDEHEREALAALAATNPAQRTYIAATAQRAHPNAKVRRPRRPRDRIATPAYQGPLHLGHLANSAALVQGDGPLSRGGLRDALTSIGEALFGPSHATA